MLRKHLLAPVIVIFVIGFVGADFSKVAQAHSAGISSKPTITVKKEGTGEQTVQKKQTKQGVKKAKAGHTKHLAKKTSKKKHPASSNVAGKKHGKKSSGASSVASSKKHAKNKHAATRMAVRKHHKKVRVAKHGARASRHQHDAAAKTENLDSASCLSGEPDGKEPIDLWMAKGGPDRFKRGADDEELDALTMKILESALSYQGTPYRYGGTTPDGFDCSGFVRHVFNENGISLGRSSRDQAREGTKVSISDLKPGDLLFFKMRRHRKNSSMIDHVGLYVGNGQFIHASSTRAREIKIEDLESGSYLPRVVEARRILDYTR